MKAGYILLIIGFVALVAGTVMAMKDIEPYADYTLVAAAVLVIFSGSLRMRNK